MKNEKENNLAELNVHMFEQLRRLNDKNLTKEQMESEIERTKGVCLLASQIISNANLALKAHVVKSGVGVPPMLLTDDTEMDDGQI
ncbi:MAG: hypothetical protein IJR92_04260 [Alphaproteobacteria bacterium]|nr:hypothetical protein [Alphaproteobacteria bacterium]